MHVGGNGTFTVLYCAIFRTPSFRKSSKFFGTSIASRSRNSPTTGILHTIRHVYRSVWPARGAKPHFGAALGLIQFFHRQGRAALTVFKQRYPSIQYFNSTKVMCFCHRKKFQSIPSSSIYVFSGADNFSPYGLV